jgi:hypothetical protein
MICVSGDAAIYRSMPAGQAQRHLRLPADGVHRRSRIASISSTPYLRTNENVVKAFRPKEK